MTYFQKLLKKKIGDKVGGQVDIQVRGQALGQVYVQVVGQVWGQVYVQVVGQVLGQTRKLL